MRCTGGEPWKPRLQRLAESRQLAPFEKLVLEVLVGCHVSPSVQRTFLANKPGSGMDEMTAMSPLTVRLVVIPLGFHSGQDDCYGAPHCKHYLLSLWACTLTSRMLPQEAHVVVAERRVFLFSLYFSSMPRKSWAGISLKLCWAYHVPKCIQQAGARAYHRLLLWPHRSDF